MQNFNIATFEVYNYHEKENLDPQNPHVEYRYGDHIRVQSESLENVHKAMALLGISYYQVQLMKDSGRGYFNEGDIVFTSEVITAINQRQEDEKKLYNKKQYDRAEKLNKLPEIITVWNFDKGYKVVLTHGEAEYKPSYSSSIQCGVYFKLIKPNKETERFWADDYITRNGKVQKAKFMEKAKYSIKDEEVRKAVVSKLKEMHKTYKEFKSKWGLRR